MGEISWEDHMKELSALQKQGQSSEVLLQINRLIKKRIPTQWRSRYADIARRAGDPLLSLRLLTHGEPSLISIQSDSEKLAYAAGLIALGNTKEAQKWLVKIKQSDLSIEGEFFKALAMIRQWDYAQALGSLQNYEKIARPTGYRSLVVRVNIAACLVATLKTSDAEKIIPRLRSDLEAEGAKLLLINLSEIEAQLQFLLKQTITSEPDAKSELGSNKLAVLFNRKWKVLASANSSPVSTLLKELEDLRKFAKEIEHWETLRDLDYYEVQITKDVALFNKLYWGTHFIAFHERLKSIPIKATNSLILGPKVSDQAILVNPWGELKHGTTLDRIFRILLTDLYRPLGLGELFEGVYPNEFFNAETSPARLQRSLFRLQTWLSEKNWGIKLEIKKGEFRLNFNSRINIILPDTKDPRLSHLGNIWGTRWFLRNDVERELQLPERSVRRLLSLWLEQGHLEKKETSVKRPEYRIYVPS